MKENPTYDKKVALQNIYTLITSYSIFFLEDLSLKRHLTGKKRFV